MSDARRYGTRSWVIALVAMTVVIVAVYIVARDDGIRLERDLGDSPSPRLLRAQRIAETIYGDVCGGAVTLVVAPLEGAGRASFSKPMGGGPATYTDCVVIVSERHQSFERLCSIVVHEYGHLDGLGHNNSNPRSVMFPRITERNIPDRCG